MDQPTMAVRARALVVPPRPAALVVVISGSVTGANHKDFREPATFSEALETAARWFAIHALGEEATCVPARG